ncbi:hypothetical protein BKA70DRAFT_1568990 [Coprinopsis sp. MPI-PUGE-AT-0042]|nr:hypothetical protein BKA70DRAFT_1568990 [Coprinopsis sp. MPI-PUGE-AT-0042]
MTETHDAYENTQSSSTRRSAPSGHETGPSMATDEHSMNLDFHATHAVGNIRLNYAFVGPSGGIPSPLPLTIPRALLNAPTAELRSIVIEKLEAEGVTLELGDIRFWRTREPLDIENALDDRDVWIQAFDRKYKAIPFTKSIFSSLGEWVQDERLLHLTVTGGEVPSIPDAKLPAFQNITMGKYFVEYTTPERRDWKDVREGERHCQDISIIQTPSTSGQSQGGRSTFSTQPPTIILGISRLNAHTLADDIQVLSYVSNVYPDSFRIHFDSFGRTLLYNGRLSWMAISPHYCYPPSTPAALQCGVADSQYFHPRKLGRRYTKQRVLFRKAYEQTPNVFSCLAGLNIGGSGSTHWDIRTFVTSIDREGFTLHIERTRDSERDVNEVIANAQVSWVAFPGGGTTDQKLACGEFYLEDGMRTEKVKTKEVEWRGRLAFTEVFTSPPQVFAAFTSFDVDRPKTLRMLVDIENISREGMEWKVKTWCDTVLYSATFAYFAVGSS